MQPNKKKLIDFIRGIYAMPTDKAVAIVEYFDERAFSRNDLLLREGRVCNEYHFLCEGFMGAWTIDLEGRDVTTAFYPAGNVVCEIIFFF